VSSESSSFAIIFFVSCFGPFNLYRRMRPASSACVCPEPVLAK
jgi:hypothetical protein